MPTSDKFCNIAALTVTESAANTLTYTKLEFGTAVFEKVGLLLHRLELFFNPGVADIPQTEDSGTVALTIGNSLASILTIAAYSDPAIIDKFFICNKISGTPAVQFWTTGPMIHDFSGLPGGGILVPAQPIYAAIQGLSAANPLTASLRMLFTYLPLKPEEYWELVSSRRVIS